MADAILLSPGISLAILCHLSPGPFPSDIADGSSAIQQRRECQRALARLARVCRGISLAALDTLWRYIDDFSFSLFALGRFDHNKKLFAANPTQADWTRFQVYTERVRELRAGDLEGLHSSVWAVLARWCPRGPLLPHLERLTGLDIDASGLSCAVLFSQTIKSLELRILESTDQNIADMTIQLAEPALRSVCHLVIDDEPAGSSQRGDTIAFWDLAQLQTLHVIHSARLTYPMLQSLSKFSALHTLHLALRSATEVARVATDPGFPSLRELSLSGHLGDICAFMAATAPANLESLTIDIERLCEGEKCSDEPRQQSGLGRVRSLEPIYARLTSTLRRFQASLNCSCSNDHFPDSNMLLVPLQVAAPGLQVLSIVFKGAKFHLADKTMIGLQDAWPNLVEFEVALTARGTPSPSPSYPRSSVFVPPGVPDPRYYGQSPPAPQPNPTDHPTSKTIAAFAHGHSNLTQLRLPSIDLYACPGIASVPFLDHGLRHLDFCTLDDDVGLVPYARALDMLFPRLDVAAFEGATARGEADKDKSDRNVELHLLLLALQLGRQVGARRAHGYADTNAASSAPGDPPAIQLIRNERRPEETKAQNARSFDDSPVTPPIGPIPIFVTTSPAGYFPPAAAARSPSPDSMH
ncbi:hypothetical protein C8Q77DRAFT_301178 [Trametes polyzona]|nr:hypothetical protein C8Q77DRAFT_301178 [Trametes polyzona]